MKLIRPHDHLISFLVCVGTPFFWLLYQICYVQNNNKEKIATKLVYMRNQYLPRTKLILENNSLLYF